MFKIWKCETVSPQILKQDTVEEINYGTNEISLRCGTLHRL